MSSGDGEAFFGRAEARPSHVRAVRDAVAPCQESALARDSPAAAVSAADFSAADFSAS